jgi:predicted ATP-binding protein involved in virulence
MTPPPTLRLNRLFLRNFRCFAECSIELHPHLTVLVAENGRGKTAVLDAIGIALGLFVDTVSGTRQHANCERTDVRLVHGEHGVMDPVLPTEFVADGDIVGQPIHWSRALKGYDSRLRITTREAKELRQAAQQLRDRVVDYLAKGGEDPPILPLVAFYGVGRLRSEYQPTGGKRLRDMMGSGRMSGYSGCLASTSSVKDVVNWYETKMNEAGDPRFSTEHPERLLAAVEKAMQVVLKPTGWCKLDWDFERKLLIVEHLDQGRLPLASLSDGVRTMVALVMDIARRCASLNPHLSVEAAQHTPGVLLIDEVDLHLHPRWQQQVVDLLRQAFPSMQIVLSTHSPHVLSAVDMKSIRIIRLCDGEGSLEIPRFQTRGVVSADVLANIMDVDPIPQVKEAQWLSNYHALIQQHLFDTTEAKDLRTRLEEHFGNEHPVIFECDRMIRLERFKQTLPSPPNQKSN